MSKLIPLHSSALFNSVAAVFISTLSRSSITPHHAASRVIVSAIIVDPVPDNILNAALVVVGHLPIVVEGVSGFSQSNPDQFPLTADVLCELETVRLIFTVCPLNER